MSPNPRKTSEPEGPNTSPGFSFSASQRMPSLVPAWLLPLSTAHTQQYEQARVPFLSPPRRLTTSGTPQLIQEQKAHQALNLNGREGTCRNKHSSLQGIWAHASDGRSQRMNRSWFLTLSTPSRSQMLTHTLPPCFLCLMIEEK